MRRPAGIAIGLGLLLLVATSAALSASATVSHHFLAFQGGRVAANLQVTRRAKGSCWTGSIADPRSDAWRCFLGNNILDPCFSNGLSSKPYAVCPETPWKKKVTLLRLTKPLPLSTGNTGSFAGKDPWGIVTSNHQRCLAITGATGLIGGKPMRYYCESGGSLAGEPNRHASIWTILFAAKGSQHLRRVAISGVWY